MFFSIKVISKNDLLAKKRATENTFARHNGATFTSSETKPMGFTSTPTNTSNVNGPTLYKSNGSTPTVRGFFFFFYFTAFKAKNVLSFYRLLILQQIFLIKRYVLKIFLMIVIQKH
jgi:hypothetical protein